jgi:DNA mismatch repair protein MutL
MTADRLIHILPEQIASQIAAGEVVERPASAIKELVENSLDAGARWISIEIERGGCALVTVADDGCGMGREDAILSLRRHATSKIRDASDLSAVRTLGFRGEALASIASVSRLVLETRRPADMHGVRITVNGGELAETRACAMASGTRIEVRDLFFNTPARLKFLKTVATEQAAAAEAVQRLALANHAVAFRLNADGRSVFDLPRAASPLERVRQLFGGKLAGRMIEFGLSHPPMRAWGLATMSQESFATPRMIFTFVNRRAVRDRLLSRAIAQAYQTLLPRGRHPAAVLFLELRLEDVDVNVHPMKTEVRFRRAGDVFELTYRALRARLADQTDASPADAESRASGAGDSAAPPSAVSPAAVLPAAAPGPPGERPLRLVPDAPPGPRAEQAPLRLGYAGGLAANRDGPAARVPLYSQLRVVGQLFAGYIALEGEGGLILIDQHAAHERVTFERLRAELREGGIRTQALLAPERLELNPAHAPRIQGALSGLRAMGFDVDTFGPSTLLLKGVPAVFGSAGGLRLLPDMIESMGQGGFGPGAEAAFEDWLKLLACHGSVRVGRALDDREIKQLLSDLDRTEFKTNCPHGRPVHIEFGRGQIERMFRR